LDQKLIDQAAKVAAFRFLRQPNKPIAPKD
jgi:hypothetical protein